MGNGKHGKRGKERYTSIPQEVLNSPAYIALDWTSKSLYVDLRLKYNGFNNGNIEAAFTALRLRRWTSATTLAKALRQLEAVGLIAKTRKTVGVENGSKLCNLYRFTDADVYEQRKIDVPASTATHDYRAFRSLKHASAVVAAASAPRKRPDPTRQLGVQKPERDAPQNAASVIGIAPLDGLGQIHSLQELARPSAPPSG